MTTKTTTKAIGEATQTTTGVERGMDATVSVWLPGATIEVDVTLLPAKDGRPVYERWGTLDHWMDGRSIKILHAALSGPRLSDAIDAIEAAASRACGRPPVE
jgi:hypothetical protein